ncbi:MAG: hypothetical protein GVY14_01850 [Spirochaetes bacterium]|jgi:hypothetical protein|nr:hypothetical protein [Spirochaetota bacterium]
MDTTHAQDVFRSLRGILEPYADRLNVERDEPDDFYLDAGVHPRTGKPTFFGAAQIKKNYVSFHLMAVYIYPELLDGISADLGKRMQGKSCFNFRTVDRALFEELAALTARGFERYRADGLIEAVDR